MRPATRPRGRSNLFMCSLSKLDAVNVIQEGEVSRYESRETSRSRWGRSRQRAAGQAAAVGRPAATGQTLPVAALQEAAGCPRRTAARTAPAPGSSTALTVFFYWSAEPLPGLARPTTAVCILASVYPSGDAAKIEVSAKSLISLLALDVMQVRGFDPGVQFFHVMREGHVGLDEFTA